MRKVELVRTMTELGHCAAMAWSFNGGTSAVRLLQSAEENWAGL
jgi:hypothetical protein